MPYPHCKTIASAAAALVCFGAQAALQDRDLNGDSFADAIYDTDLDITWLRDANVNGLMQWKEANTWARTLSVHGVGGWRLPTSDTCLDYCSGSEMGHLWYVELKNSPEHKRHTGNFLNLGPDPSLNSDNYWSSTAGAIPGTLYIFQVNRGTQYYSPDVNFYYAMAVHDGDVGAVPEPATYALMLAGLAGLAVTLRRRIG